MIDPRNFTKSSDAAHSAVKATLVAMLCIALTLQAGIAFAAHVNQDLTTYNEYDPNNELNVVDDHRVEYNGIDQNSSADLYKQVLQPKGSVYELEFSFELTSGGSDDNVYVGGVSGGNSEDGNIASHSLLYVDKQGVDDQYRVFIDTGSEYVRISGVGAEVSLDSTYYVTMRIYKSSNKVRVNVYETSSRDTVYFGGTADVASGSWDTIHGVLGAGGVAGGPEGFEDQGETTTGYSQDFNYVGLNTISGQVKNDSSGDGIDGATVEVRDSGGTLVNTVTADENGRYEVAVEQGEYNVTAKAAGYWNESKDVEVSGSDETLGFRLVSKGSTLSVDAPAYMKHGTTADYNVSATIRNKSTGEFETIRVTPDTTVTSNDTTVITVDEFQHTLTATSNNSINKRTYITATWTNPDTGTTYTTNHNITVANETIENVGILPPTQKVTASVADGNWHIIFLATAAAAAVTIIATSFAGLATFEVMMIGGWVLGRVELPILLAATFMVLFVGLNVTQNIDYSVRR